MVAAAGNAALLGDGDLDRDADRFRFCTAVHVLCVSATGPTAVAGVDGTWEQMTWKNVDAVAPYTNFGRSAIDVVGPGGTELKGDWTNVWLACSQVTELTRREKDSDVCIGATTPIWPSTGTSFAAATSGLAARLVSTIGKGRPDQIAAAITQSADDPGDLGTDLYYGEGRINVAAR